MTRTEAEYEALQKKYKTLEEEFEQYRKESIKWSVEDFTSAERVNITDEQAQVLLERMISKHDASYGINWETIACYLTDAGHLEPLN